METTFEHESAASGNEGNLSLPLVGPPGHPRAEQSVLVAAISRSWILILFLTILTTGGGIAFGIKRKPVYTASATLQVGRANPNSPGFYGFIQSATSLASTLSRGINAYGVLRRVQKQTHLSPVQSVSRLSATPIPDGAAFTVTGTGTTAASAIKLANVAASALIAFEQSSNFTTSNTDQIFRQYTAQATELAKAHGKLASLERRIGATNPQDPSLLAAQAQVDGAKTKETALSAAYTQALQSGPVVSNLLQPLAKALVATNDRKHKIELYGFAGLAAGLLVGTGLAALRELRRRNRFALA